MSPIRSDTKAPSRTRNLIHVVRALFWILLGAWVITASLLEVDTVNHATGIFFVSIISCYPQFVFLGAIKAVIDKRWIALMHGAAISLQCLILCVGLLRLYVLSKDFPFVAANTRALSVWLIALILLEAGKLALLARSLANCLKAPEAS